MNRCHEKEKRPPLGSQAVCGGVSRLVAAGSCKGGRERAFLCTKRWFHVFYPFLETRLDVRCDEAHALTPGRVVRPNLHVWLLLRQLVGDVARRSTIGGMMGIKAGERCRREVVSWADICLVEVELMTQEQQARRELVIMAGVGLRAGDYGG